MTVPVLGSGPVMGLTLVAVNDSPAGREVPYRPLGTLPGAVRRCDRRRNNSGVQIFDRDNSLAFSKTFGQ
jgi:hypothetical protein